MSLLVGSGAATTPAPARAVPSGASVFHAPIEPSGSGVPPAGVLLPLSVYDWICRPLSVTVASSCSVPAGSLTLRVR